MKIYDVPTFSNPARVRIALAEKNATEQVEFIEVDVIGGEHREPAFHAKNPSGTLPALELDDGATISECTAITEFTDHAFDGPSLSGKMPKQRAIVHMMQRRAEEGLLDAVGAYFHDATPGLGPTLETYQNKAWGDRQKRCAIAGMRYLDGVLAFADFAKAEIPGDSEHLMRFRRLRRRSSPAEAVH